MVFPTGATGVSTTVSTIIALNNLYPGASPGCGSTTPETIYWAYNTTITATAPGSVTTSPVLSPDGTKVAYIQGTGTAANLIVLKTATGPATGLELEPPIRLPPLQRIWAALLPA